MSAIWNKNTDLGHLNSKRAYALCWFVEVN